MVEVISFISLPNSNVRLNRSVVVGFFLLLQDVDTGSAVICKNNDNFILSLSTSSIGVSVLYGSAKEAERRFK